MLRFRPSAFDTIADRLLGYPRWDKSTISEEWFRIHFEYAAKVVADWLGLVEDVKTLSILDFGCGEGITDLGVLLQHRPRALYGVDVKAEFCRLPALAKREIGLKRLPSNVSFEQIEPGTRLSGRYRVNAITSWSVFEHIDRRFLDGVTADLYALLPAGGIFFLQIDPLYYSPFGSHLGRFLDEPWAHLTCTEVELRKAVVESKKEMPAHEIDTNFASLGIEAYKRSIFDEIFLDLNRLTADELVELLRKTGFDIVREDRRLVDETPSDQLASRYGVDQLRTAEIKLLLRKPR